jgi:hypothetical protein
VSLLSLFLGVVAISMPLLGRETAPHDEREFRRAISLSLLLFSRLILKRARKKEARGNEERSV